MIVGCCEKPDLLKKKVVFYGNCHTTAIRTILEQYKPFSSKYQIMPVKAIQEISDSSYFDQPLIYECDIFIHQAIRANNKFGPEYSSDRIIEKLKNDCQIISIPNVYHLPMCFFPQYSEAEGWKNHNGDLIFFRDSILDGAFSDGLSLTETVKLYSNPSLFNGQVLKEMYASFITKIREREKEWDIKVSSFIEDSFQNTRLFYDPNHPTTEFLMHIVRGLLDILDVEFNEEEMAKISPLKLYPYEMPITQSVLETFKMSFPIENIRFDGKTFFSNLTLEEYIRSYWIFEWQNEELDITHRKKSKRMYYCYYVMSVSKIIRYFSYLINRKILKIISHQ